MEHAAPHRHLVHGSPPADFRGHCLRCGREHVLENDVALAHAAIEGLFTQLESDESLAEFRHALSTSLGKMIGVLIAEGEGGHRHVLRAYSGELAGRRDWPGWVGPVLRREDTAVLEAKTLARIAELDAQIATCDVDRAQRYLAEMRESARHAAAERRLASREQRHEWGLLRRDDIDVLKDVARREREAATAADEARVEAARHSLLTERERLHQLREARTNTSRVLSTAIYDAAAVTNARGERRLLREVFVGHSIAGGTTDCTVPKLLEAANVARLRPVAMAEAWWGPSIGTRHHGDLQLPCERKCQPILGYLLCGLDCP